MNHTTPTPSLTSCTTLSLRGLSSYASPNRMEASGVTPRHDNEPLLLLVVEVEVLVLVEVINMSTAASEIVG